MTKVAVVLIAASAAFAIIGGIDSCNQRKVAEAAKKKLEVSDSILRQQKKDIATVLESSSRADSTNAELTEANKKLEDSLTVSQDSVKKLKESRKQIRLQLAEATSAQDTIGVQNREIANLDETVEQQGKTIFSLRVKEANNLTQITNLTDDRNRLRSTLENVNANTDRLLSLNAGLEKDLAKLRREPLVDFDVGIGISTLPFNDWETGPSINATVSLHP